MCVVVPNQPCPICYLLLDYNKILYKYYNFNWIYFVSEQKREKVLNKEKQ